MTYRLSDTIVAPITAQGRGAVAWVRVSGPEAWAIAANVFSPWPVPVKPRFALYGRFVSGDDGLALPFPAGGSYTGDESVEMSVHGSPASVRALVEACLAAGCRMAEPGEFTLRAYAAGRLDLSQAEGVRDSVEAQSAAQLRQASRLREGEVRGAVSGLVGNVRALLAEIDARTDFSEELGELDHPAFAQAIGSALVSVQELLLSARSARLLREGASVVLTGPPNVGKSSLLNALLASDRALVTPIPGTTRDTLEEWVEIEGIAIRLTDTAGLRETTDEVERLGVARTRTALESADLVLTVVDAAAFAAPEVEGLRVANKVDLAPAPDGYLGVSATTGEGLAELRRAIVAALGVDFEAAPLRPRHAVHLASAADALREAASAIRSDLPLDLAHVHLQRAEFELGLISGDSPDPDGVDRLFRDFCVGK